MLDSLVAQQKDMTTQHMAGLKDMQLHDARMDGKLAQ